MNSIACSAIDNPRLTAARQRGALWNEQRWRGNVDTDTLVTQVQTPMKRAPFNSIVIVEFFDTRAYRIPADAVILRMHPQNLRYQMFPDHKSHSDLFQCCRRPGVRPTAINQRGVARPQTTACDIGAVERKLFENEIFADGFELEIIL